MLKLYFQKLIKSKAFSDIFKLGSAQIFLRPFQILKSFVVARFLGPEVYGILKSIEIIQMLNKFGNLGFKETVIRDGIPYITLNEKLKLKKLKNNAFSGEIILSILLVFIGFFSSLFFDNQLIKISIILASLGLFTSKMFGIIKTELTLNRNFDYLSKIILVNGILNTVFIIITVPFFNIYSVLSVPIITSLLIIFYVIYSMGIFFKFEFDKKEFKKIFKVSLPLTASTLSFGIFKYTERILIISFFSLSIVGFFGFAETIANIFITLFIGTVMKVRGLRVFELLSQNKYYEVNKLIIKETSFLIGLSLIILVILSAALNILIPIILPKWTSAINIAILFSLCIPLKLISSYAIFAIKSKELNKLKFEPITYLISASILLIGTLILYYTKNLNIYNFIIIDLIAIFFVQIITVFYYLQLINQKIKGFKISK
tara:strand:- start:3 stop:1295 length:1293 start_codon:yes stop_codon:yes gene_type:complete